MLSARLRDPVLSLFRIVVGLLFVIHGASSVFGIFGGARGTGLALDVGQWPGWWAGLIQLGAGGLVLIGLFTRTCATLCSGSMAYAYFVVHQPKDLLPMHNGGELPAMFCWAFLLIAVLGAGSWSLESLLRHHRRRPEAAPGA